MILWTGIIKEIPGVLVKGMRGKGKGMDIEALQKPLPLTRGTGFLISGGQRNNTPFLWRMFGLSSVILHVGLPACILHHKFLLNRHVIMQT